MANNNTAPKKRITFGASTGTTWGDLITWCSTVEDGVPIKNAPSWNIMKGANGMNVLKKVEEQPNEKFGKLFETLIGVFDAEEWSDVEVSEIVKEPEFKVLTLDWVLNRYPYAVLQALAETAGVATLPKDKWLLTKNNLK